MQDLFVPEYVAIGIFKTTCVAILLFCFEARCTKDCLEFVIIIIIIIIIII